MFKSRYTLLFFLSAFSAMAIAMSDTKIIKEFAIHYPAEGYYSPSSPNYYKMSEKKVIVRLFAGNVLEVSDIDALIIPIGKYNFNEDNFLSKINRELSEKMADECGEFSKALTKIQRTLGLAYFMPSFNLKNKGIKYIIQPVVLDQPWLDFPVDLVKAYKNALDIVHEKKLNSVAIAVMVNGFFNYAYMESRLLETKENVRKIIFEIAQMITRELTSESKQTLEAIDLYFDSSEDLSAFSYQLNRLLEHQERERQIMRDYLLAKERAADEAQQKEKQVDDERKRKEEEAEKERIIEENINSLFYKQLAALPDTPWNILGISRKASSDEIRKAYRVLATKWHPDRNLDKPEEATKMTKNLNSARDLALEIHDWMSLNS